MRDVRLVSVDGAHAIGASTVEGNHAANAPLGSVAITRRDIDSRPRGRIRRIACSRLHRRESRVAVELVGNTVLAGLRPDVVNAHSTMTRNASRADPRRVTALTSPGTRRCLLRSKITPEDVQNVVLCEVIKMVRKQRRPALRVFAHGKSPMSGQDSRIKKRYVV
jgi:hypothetical protein